MEKTSKIVLLIFMMYLTTAISACFNLNVLGIIIAFIIIAIIMYLLSPYLVKIIECGLNYSSSGGGASQISKGKKDGNIKISTSSYGPAKIELRLGSGLIGYAQEYADGKLTVLIAQLRNKLILNYKFELPPVGIINDKLLNENEYKIRLLGEIVHSGFVNLDSDCPSQDIVINIEKLVIRNLSKLK